METELTLGLIVFINLLSYFKSLAKVIPPSFNVNALANYADITVNNYT